MSSLYNGNPAGGALSPAIQIQEPADTDAANVASVNTALSKIADYIAYLQAYAATLTVDSTAVHKTGTETVAGVKTFSSSPVVPTPAGPTEAANKGYIDAKFPAPSWTGLTLNTGGGWSDGAGAYAAGYLKDADGVVHLKGAITSGGSLSAQIALTGALPAGFRPAGTRVMVLNYSGGFMGASIGANGSILLNSAPTSAMVYNIDCSWVAEI